MGALTKRVAFATGCRSSTERAWPSSASPPRVGNTCGRTPTSCSYGSAYGDSAEVEAHAGQKWIYLREDALLPVALRFFEQRIFGPMRLEKLAKQLRAHGKEQRRSGKLAATRLRQEIADVGRKIKLQIEALEDGVEPELVSESASSESRRACCSRP